jgi:hypothetical protein
MKHSQDPRRSRRSRNSSTRRRRREHHRSQRRQKLPRRPRRAFLTNKKGQYVHGDTRSVMTRFVYNYPMLVSVVTIGALVAVGRKLGQSVGTAVATPSPPQLTPNFNKPATVSKPRQLRRIDKLPASTVGRTVGQPTGAGAAPSLHPPQRLTPDFETAETLRQLQVDQLPKALRELQKHSVKQSHWAWWAFPTDRGGRGERLSVPRTIKVERPTKVTPETAQWLLQNAPPVWQDVLEEVCDLVERDGPSVLPPIDHGRVKYFVTFWKKQPSRECEWMADVCRRLQKINWE